MNAAAFELSVVAGKTGFTILFLFILYRLLGKRQLAQFNVYDLVTLLAVASAVQNGMTMGKGQLSVGLVSATTLLLLGWLVTRLVTKQPKFEHLLFGTPMVLVSDGHVISERMKVEHVSHEELIRTMREHGLCHVSEVRLAVLEIDGTISIVPAKKKEE